MKEMKRYRRLISIGNDVDTSKVLAKVSYVAKMFEDADESWAVDIDLSITSYQHEPYAIPKDISEAMIKLFRTIANARRRLSPLWSDDGLKPEKTPGDGPLTIKCRILDNSDGIRTGHKKVDRLFLEIHPTIRDDANFRDILEIGTV